LNLGCDLSFGLTKCSISARVNSLTLSKPDLGAISFLNACPICAAANGNLPPLNSNNLLKLTKIPCAVSGLKNLIIY
jgi:hypothetical protein